MKKYKIKVDTNYPVAFDSPDHQFPVGTKNDNYTKPEFIEDIESLFNYNRLNFMDLGCSGGLLVHDLVRRGHIAVGLEGSDYSLYHGRAEWPVLYQRNLFTCDISKPFHVMIIKDDEPEAPFLCDVISAWEVVEHIHPNELLPFFENIRKHLKINGIFLASISLAEMPPLHQSVFSAKHWFENILSKLPGFRLCLYPFDPTRAVRFYRNSIYICLQRID